MTEPKEGTFPPESATAISAEVLAGRTGHQLANLITPMLGYLELARLESQGDTKSLPLLDTFEALTRRMFLVTQNLLWMRQRPLGYTRPAELSSFVRRAVEVLERTGLARQHTLRVADETAGRTILIDAEGEQPQHLFCCLLQNAAEAMTAPGCIAVTIGPATATDCPVQIADEGPGIAPDLREHVFEPLVTTKANGQALGLGLYVARLLAERHRGTLELGDNHPTGLVVTVRLPLAQAMRT